VTDPVTVVRRFNRSYTQRIGALEDSFLGMGMPLGPARLLFEIGTGESGAGVNGPGKNGTGPTALALRERLGLDSGYLSRLLRTLEKDSLIEVVADQDDRRRRRITLTDRGRERWQELDRRSDDRARGLIEPLTDRQRQRLAAALAEADLLVRAATVTIDPVSPGDPMAREAVARYFAEIGRRFGFDPAGETDKDAKYLVPPTGRFLVAASDGAPVACGGVQTIAPAVGELKRMWVDDEWRGVGLGSRLLRALESEARALGHETLRLDTNKALTEAIGMYQRAGYAAIERYNDNPWATHFFSKSLSS
jgi:DNA-binding MarR family transcriptional regulator/predicted N-acetyltransferase YhbS